MGDRISIQFSNPNETWQPVSVALFEHWAGESMKGYVEEFITELNNNQPKKVNDPLTRREPNTVMVQFIGWLFTSDKFDNNDSSIYLGEDENYGDNSDNGNHVFNLVTDSWE